MLTLGFYLCVVTYIGPHGFGSHILFSSPGRGSIGTVILACVSLTAGTAAQHLFLIGSSVCRRIGM